MMSKKAKERKTKELEKLQRDIRKILSLRLSSYGFKKAA